MVSFTLNIIAFLAIKQLLSWCQHPLSEMGHSNELSAAKCMMTFSLEVTLLSADEGMWDTFVRHLPPTSTSHSVNLDRLRQGISYQFRVLAINEFGYGEPSVPSAAMSGNYTLLMTCTEMSHQRDFDRVLHQLLLVLFSSNVTFTRTWTLCTMCFWKSSTFLADKSKWSFQTCFINFDLHVSAQIQ